jgi:hypothetical protein
MVIPLVEAMMSPGIEALGDVDRLVEGQGLCADEPATLENKNDQ